MERRHTQPGRARKCSSAPTLAARVALGLRDEQSPRRRNQSLPAPARGQSGRLVALGAEALATARTQDKPILLSIGYSACHWCHVMAHESFEDGATARLMNDLFVCIKVDREERPDLDKIYQLAHQALTRRGGGWPLTVFLGADDLTPFYAGTYFPKEARYGMPPFAYVLQQVRAFWDQRRDEVRTQNAVLREFLDDHGRSEASTATLTDASVHAAVAQIGQNFDHVHGGHLGAPKFPHCAELELLLDLSAQAGRHGRGRAPYARGQHVADETMVETHAAAHGRGRDPRSDRRWLLPLQRRRALGDSAFREDALRQCATAAAVCRAHDRRRCDARDARADRVAAARDDRTDGRLLRRARCGFRA